jgi:hypothetical protein
LTRSCDSKFSCKDFTRYQLFAALALHEFLKQDYRGIEQVPRDWVELREALVPIKIPRPLHPPEGGTVIPCPA